MFAVVLRATKQVSHGDLVNPSTVTKDIIDISYIKPHMISRLDHNATFEFRNYIEKNQIIESWMIQQQPDFKKGEEVKVSYKKDNISLILSAYLLENGIIGDTVKLKLTTNQKIMSGKIYDKNTIIISSR